MIKRLQDLRIFIAHHIPFAPLVHTRHTLRSGYMVRFCVSPVLIVLFTVCIVLLHSDNYAKALEGIVKFPGKPDATVVLEIAVSDEEKAKGLMKRPNLPQNRGMVFVFRPARLVTFWMKDTLISLDMIFIDKGRIVKIAKNAIPIQTQILYPSDFEVTEVIEVNGGFTDKYMIETGSTVQFENIAQIDYSGKSQLMIVGK